MADGEKVSAPDQACARQRAGVCVVLRAETNPGADEEFLALASDLAFQIRAEEAGCRSYIITRQMGSREHIAIHAQFANWDAFRHHAETPHMRRALPRLAACLAAPVSMEIFLEV